MAFAEGFVIPKARPAQASVEWQSYEPRFSWPGSQDPFGRRASRTATGVYACGDYLEPASIQGALASGVRTATAVAEDLGGSTQT